MPFDRLRMTGVLLVVVPALCAVGAMQKFCSGCDFSGALLASADFSGGTYIGTNFENAVLTGASFRQARLVAANFNGADLRGASFDGAQCTACNFKAAKLDGASFSATQMLAANFGGLAAAGLGDASLRGLLGGCVACNLQRAALAGRNLSGLPLLSISFGDADLRGADFSGAALCWYVTAKGSRTIACDALGDADTQGANFSNVAVCEDPIRRQGCTPVDATTLRRFMEPASSATPSAAP